MVSLSHLNGVDLVVREVLRVLKVTLRVADQQLPHLEVARQLALGLQGLLWIPIVQALLAS